MLVVSYRKINGYWSVPRRPINPHNASDDALIAAFTRLNKFSVKVKWWLE